LFLNFGNCEKKIIAFAVWTFLFNIFHENMRLFIHVSNLHLNAILISNCF